MLRIVYLLLLGLVWGCGPAKTELGAKPTNLIPTDKMAQMLVQVHLNEARVAKYGLGSPDSASIVYHRMHLRMLQKFGVDTSAYTNSYIYYSANPALLAGIYERVVDDLKRLQHQHQQAASKKPI